MVASSQKVLLGKVAGPHGIRGQLRVVPYSGQPDTILTLKTVLLAGERGEAESFRVEGAAVHGKKVLLALEGFNNINQVLHLVGREIYVEREQLPELPADEFYWCDLIGLTVKGVDGNLLGTLEDIIATGSNDVYVVRGEGREYLIPALEEVVLQVDLADGVMTVDPPEGLFDL